MAECYSINYTRVFALAVTIIAYWNRRELNVYCRAFVVAFVYWFRRDLLRHLRAIARAVVRGRVEEIVITHSGAGVEILGAPGDPGIHQQNRRRGRPSNMSRQYGPNRNMAVLGSPGPSGPYLTGVGLLVARHNTMDAAQHCYQPAHEPLVRRTRTGTIYSIF